MYKSKKKNHFQDENLNISLNQICSFISGKEQRLELSKEYYSITLNLIMPNVDLNYKRGKTCNFLIMILHYLGAFSLDVYFIDAQKKINKISNLVDFEYSPIIFINIYLGFDVFKPETFFSVWDFSKIFDFDGTYGR